MKRFLKKILPALAITACHRVLRGFAAMQNAQLSPREVFSEIYRLGKWGRGERRFHSGSGTANRTVVDPYVAYIYKQIRGVAVVDLGCGDFSIGEMLLGSCGSYVGVDVVPELIAHLQSTVTDRRAKFVCMDIIEDELPPGEICLVRQVFQHLSNAQIARVLSKLPAYKTIFITEHQAADDQSPIHNLDKVHGADVRFFDRSGVYLDKPPFSLNVEVVLEIRDTSMARLYGNGVIRTYKLSGATGFSHMNRSG
jgi:hypothetical protein